MKKLSVSISVLLLVCMSMSSCFVNRFTVGDGPVGRANNKVVFSKARQMYLFWGLIGLGQSQPPLPPTPGYQLKTSFNFIDAIVSTLTGGIFGMRTVKIYIFRDQMRILQDQRKEAHDEKKAIKDHE